MLLKTQSFLMLKAQRLMWRSVEWGRNVQIWSLQLSTVFISVLSVLPVMLLLICPSGVHSCLSCLLAMLFSNAYKIMTERIVGSCGSFLSLCCRDPRNSGCLLPDSASDLTLMANELFYYKTTWQGLQHTHCNKELLQWVQHLYCGSSLSWCFCFPCSWPNRTE